MRYALAVIFGVLPCVALAHDGHPSHDAWYESLREPQTGQSCCNLRDCKPAEYRIDKEGRYEVLLSREQLADWHLDMSIPMFSLYKNWVVVPDKAIIRDPKVLASNPTGQAVVCWTPYAGILCFIPASGV